MIYSAHNFLNLGTFEIVFLILNVDRHDIHSFMLLYCLVTQINTFFRVMEGKKKYPRHLHCEIIFQHYKFCCFLSETTF